MATRTKKTVDLDKVKLPVHFQAKKNFPNETRPGVVSKYFKGGVYTIREGNIELLEAAKRWQKQGKIEVLPPDGPAPTAKLQARHSGVTARGTVSD